MSSAILNGFLLYILPTACSDCVGIWVLIVFWFLLDSLGFADFLTPFILLFWILKLGIGLLVNNLNVYKTDFWLAMLVNLHQLKI